KVPGTVFRLSPDRTSFTTLHTFDPGFSTPGPIAIATDGNLYGIASVTRELYRISAPESATPTYTTLASPPLGGSLIQALDGHFYANGAFNDAGQIYRITTA